MSLAPSLFEAALKVLSSTNAESDTHATDPVLQAILTLFGGAAIAALIGLLGASIQGRREHSRWLREKRYEAYKAVLVDHDFLHLGAARASEEVRFTVEHKQSAAEAVSLLGLLGPAKMYRVASQYQDAVVKLLEFRTTSISAAQWEPIEKKRTELAIAMQAALGVPKRERFNFGPKRRSFTKTLKNALSSVGSARRLPRKPDLD